MTGWNWDCSEECYRHAPELYGAIHFHDDDLDDCRWETDVALEIPADLASDVYALRARSGRGRGLHPVLRPAPARHRDGGHPVPRADRQLPRLRQRPHRPRRAGRAVDPRSHDRASRSRTSTLYGNLDIGLSTYDVHSDGSGVCFSSSRRPIINMRPEVPARHGLRVAVPCRPPSGRLAARGGLLLRRRHRPRAAPRGRRPAAPLPRRAHRLAPRVLQRAHARRLAGVPRRWRSRHVPRLQRLLLGHVVAPREALDDRGAQVRVRLARLAGQAGRVLPRDHRRARRALAQSRARAAEALRQSVSRPEGFDHCVGYHQMPDARDPRAAFILEGVGPDEVIGDFGLAGGGAAGYEIDRYDLALGTPPNSCCWPRASTTR